MQISYLRYAGIYVLTVIGLAALAWAMATFLGFDFPAGAGSVIPTMIAALAEGQNQARATGKAPERRALWGAAFSATLIVAAINGVFMVVLMQMPSMAELFRAVPANFLVMLGVFVLIVTLLTNWWFLGVGAKAGAKSAG
ncbi:hypothetical protein E4Z66_14570 [Aliishimia ponticola]|uniref:Uncharacterized protein n=1 Tax=Aliishimia ponticola TaxID=2499833 RepID=A0A4V6S204_9RHOB|nr:ABZJ_00895 family protein [Aliishimia ponticola]THH35053.1 hypothetical protein E4Z66_14570 [Aliishimia ponticola]